MNRTYTFKLEDFTDDSKVSYVNIISCDGIDLYYNNTKVSECIVNSTGITNLYVHTEDSSDVKASIVYSLSYDGVNFSKCTSTLNLILPEISIKSDKCETIDYVKEYIISDNPIDFDQLYIKLIYNGLVSQGECPVLIPILRKNKDIPDRYKGLIDEVKILPPPNAIVLLDYSPKSNDIIFTNSSFRLEDIDRSYILIRNRSSYSSCNTVSVEDKSGNVFDYELSEFTVNDKEYDVLWDEWYNEKFN